MMQYQILPQETPSTYSPPLDVNTTLLQEVNPETLDTLISDFEEKNRRRKRRFLIKVGVTEAFCFTGMIGILFVEHYKRISETAVIAGVILIFIALVGKFIGFITMFLHMFQPLNFDVSKLTQSGGIRTIPTLIHSSNSALSIKAHKMIQRELTFLLPLLKTSDANLLKTADRRFLNIWLNNELHGHLLKFKPDIDFVLAILKAYEQVGDAKALPLVERLASRRPRSERQRCLREAALNCLPLLQSNTGAIGHTQTLLRVASKITATPETLLRPAAHAQPAVPDELHADPTASETPLS